MVDTDTRLPPVDATDVTLRAQSDRRLHRVLRVSGGTRLRATRPTDFSIDVQTTAGMMSATSQTRCDASRCRWSGMNAGVAIPEQSRPVTPAQIDALYGVVRAQAFDRIRVEKPRRRLRRGRDERRRRRGRPDLLPREQRDRERQGGRRTALPGVIAAVDALVKSPGSARRDDVVSRPSVAACIGRRRRCAAGAGYAGRLRVRPHRAAVGVGRERPLGIAGLRHAVADLEALPGVRPTSISHAASRRRVGRTAQSAVTRVGAGVGVGDTSGVGRGRRAGAAAREEQTSRNRNRGHAHAAGPIQLSCLAPNA